jgi:hypothetical protein
MRTSQKNLITAGIVFCLSPLFSVINLFGQTNIDMEQVLPILIGAGSFSDFERTNVMPMSSGALDDSKTNISFIVNTPEPCPAKYTNVISNTNLFSPAEQKLLIELPIKYESVTTNLPPLGSKFVGMESGNFWSEGYTIGRFQQTNSETQTKVFFDKHSNGRAALASFRTKSGDGYDLSFSNDGLIQGFRQFKHGKLDGLWADFESNHCAGWMHFTDGKAVGKWLVWNRTGSLFMEAEFKEPYDFIGHLNSAGM